MYEYKEKTQSIYKLGHCNAKRKNSFDKSETTQFKFVDKETHSKVVQCFSGKPVIQLIRFDAGEGKYWHIHKNHIKYGNDTSTRIDFNQNDTAEDILLSLQQLLDGRPTLGRIGLDACKKWIKKHY